MITAAELRALVSYDPKTGQFMSLQAAHSGRWKPGRALGTDNGIGYLVARLGGQKQYLHRMAYLYMTGEHPPAEIDHINRNRADNRWANLRPATAGQNKYNFPLMRSNSSGCAGVSYSARDKRFHAYIGVGGTRKNIGYFKTLEEAVAARLAAVENHHGEYGAVH
jgi:hypothetical protein